MAEKARHLLFIDESGTHDMRNVDPRSPVFVLLGLLVGERYYARTLVSRVKRLKRKHGLAGEAVLHSRHIRRWEGEFQFLADPERRATFYNDLNELFQTSRFRLYAIVIDKRRLQERFLVPGNPYDISLSQLLSLVCGPPGVPGPWRPNVSRIIAESRGKREDKELQAVYQHYRRTGLHSFGAPEVQSRQPRTVVRLFPSRVDFVRKSRVVAGLELADLAAYPIGRAEINQSWDNPAYLVVADKLRAKVAFP
jgi:hypothetical protein